jgi:L-ribulose-5-phosphate 3-epimerase
LKQLIPGCTSFGAMQGRLSEQTEFGYQAFPKNNWKKEFHESSQLGLEHIEWVVDSATIDSNPILSDSHSLQSVIRDTGVNVISVCGDFLMDVDFDLSGSELETLELICSGMESVGATILVVPCVDQSSLLNQASVNRFLHASSALELTATKFGLRLALETDLPPAEFESLLEKLNPEIFGVNYDIGNSASLGYNASEEIDTYGSRINLVHIKDRLRGGASVVLGTGDAEVLETVRYISNSGYKGPYTMQAYRDHEGLDIFVDQLRWLETHLNGNGN